jgi:hypothetical protein
MAQACAYETSWYPFLQPELVRMDRIVADLLKLRSATCAWT